MFSVYYLVTKLSYFSFSWLLPVMCYIGHKYKHDLSIHHLSLNLGMSQPSDIVDSRLTGFLSFHVPQIRFPLWLKRESLLLCLFLCWLYHGQKMSLGKTLCCSSQFHKLVNCSFQFRKERYSGILVVNKQTVSFIGIWLCQVHDNTHG